jgi:hypothetical protein
MPFSHRPALVPPSGRYGKSGRRRSAGPAATAGDCEFSRLDGDTARWRHDIPIVMMRNALLCGHRRERSRLGRSGCPDRGCLRYGQLLGPAGLVLLGLFVLFICTAMNLYEDAPSWGTEIFKARIASHGSPEQRAAMFDEKRASLSPLRFYRWCGVVLVVAGAAGFAWQQLR